MRAIAAWLLLTVGSSNALVDFSHSTLYDVYDFIGTDEVQIPNCNMGCRIYASTAGKYNTDDGLDPFAKNLLIVDNVAQLNYSLAVIAPAKNAQTKQKVPLEFKKPSKISVVNVNDKDEKPFNIVLYVVDLATATANLDHEIYDLNDVAFPKGVVTTINTRVVTVMSTMPFYIAAQPTAKVNLATARLTGFDDALDSNPDGCPFAYQTPASNAFPGFKVDFPGPIASIVFSIQAPMRISADWSIGFMPDMATGSGSIVSAGYSGCNRPGIGPLQTFRNPEVNVPNSVILQSHDDYSVHMELLPNLKDGHKIILTDNSFLGKTYTVTESTTQIFTFPKTQSIFVDNSQLAGTEGYILRYYTDLINKPTTTMLTTEALTTSPLSSTEAMTYPTTSGVQSTAGISLLSLLSAWALARVL